MIITRIIGGLGNQMFQYAIGRNLASKMKTNLKLDVKSFDNYSLRSYGLNVFNIHENFATKKELRKFKLFDNTIAKRIKPILPDSLKYSIYLEKKEFCFDPEIYEMKGHLYLKGYWQNPKYFEDIEEIIKNEFTIKTKPKGKNQEFLLKIQKCNSVALHVRQGDFVNNLKTYKKHGICSLNYYKKATRIIKDKVNEPYFFVFSDNPEWCTKYLKIDSPAIFMSHNNQNKDFEDLRLMKNCKHFIIANSSFSWWGAWLSNNPQKIVIAPKKWLNINSVKTTNLIPENWIKINRENIENH